MKTTNIVSDSISSREVGESATAMSIDESSSVFLMDMLGKLYARPALAVLREYLSNAHDAHVAKGGELPPIEIVLPHNHSKLLSIRDYGNGVDEEQFSTILSRYGNSTKRDSNEFIGGFGLGAKAGFALNNEFFMTSYQNGAGLRTRFYKDAKNQGYVEIVERFQTTESDGLLVEVVIPKAHLDEFTAGNIDTLMLAYGPEKTKITPAAGKGRYSLLEPTQFAQLEFNDNIVGWVGRNSLKGKADSYAVIGKVVYGLDWEEIIGRGDTELSDFGMYFKYSEDTHVINLPIGSVDLPSSREEIILSERSLATLRGALANYIRTLHAHAQTEINNGDYWQAMLQIGRLEKDRYPKLDNFTWRGKELGIALLSGTKMLVKSLREKRTVQFASHTISQFERTETFIDVIASLGVKTFLILAETDAEIKELSSTLTEAVARLILITECPDKNSKLRGASFLILTKDDPLYEMVSHFPHLERSVLSSKHEEAVELRIKMEEAFEEQKQKELAEKTARAERMITSFRTTKSRGNEQNNHSYFSYSDVDEVFNADNAGEVKYYWSEEELLALNGNVASAFPYERTEEGLYKCLSDADPNNMRYSDNYHWKLHAFLDLFLAPDALVILLGKNVNLTDFKKHHPEVESGVAIVASEIVPQLQDEKSEINTLRGLMINSYRIRTGVPIQVAEFAEELTDSQKEELHPNFIETMESLERIHVMGKKKGRINEYYLNELLPVFCSDIPPAPDVWKEHEKLEKKYPLFFFGSDFEEEDVISDLIDYINAKNA